MKDYLIYVINSIRQRKIRSWLNIIAVVIGIAAIISLISISQGLQNFIGEQFEKLGTNRIYIFPKMPLGMDVTQLEVLTQDDVDTIKSIAELEWVNPYLVKSGEIEFGREKGFAQNIWAIEIEDVEKKFSDLDFSLEQGRYPKNNEKGVAVIGYKLTHDFFDEDVHLNSKIKIKDKGFKVIGIMDEIGNEEDDNSIFIGLDELRDLFDASGVVTMIEVKIKKGFDVNNVADKINRKLKRARDDESFNIMTPEQIMEQMGSILDIVKLVLVSIAAISLIVGGIGIMNSMFTSVLERTREIGVMKAIGAKNNAILTIFLIEAGLIGLIGGVIGIILASGIAYFAGYAAAQAGYGIIKIEIDLKLMAIGIAFAFLVGILAGYLPARRAVKLKPVEALR